MSDRLAPSRPDPETTHPHPTWGVPARTLGAIAVLGSCLAIQGSAALAAPLFAEMGAPGVAAWRQVIGGLALLVVFRPQLRHRSRRTWLFVAGLGAAMASMNLLYYATVDRLPLGVAASLLYLGAFVLSAAAIRDRRRLVWPFLALGGVFAITRPDQASEGSFVGLVLGALAATALALYTLLSRHLGSIAGFGELALAVSFSGLLLSPIALTHLPSRSGDTWTTLITIGVVGVGVAFMLDYAALRLAGTAVVATLFALDPSIGALLGGLMLDDDLSVTTLAGIGLVVVAGIGLTRSSERA